MSAAAQIVPISVVEPFPAASVASLWRWIESFRDRVCDDSSPTTFAGFLELYAAQLEQGMRTWGVYRDDELGGHISIRPINPFLAESHITFSRRFWGEETTVPALRAVYTEIFNTTTIRTITSQVFEDNHTIMQLAKKNGAVIETPRALRDRAMRGGKPIGVRIVTLFKETF